GLFRGGNGHIDSDVCLRVLANAEVTFARIHPATRMGLIGNPTAEYIRQACGGFGMARIVFSRLALPEFAAKKPAVDLLARPHREQVVARHQLHGRCSIHRVVLSASIHLLLGWHRLPAGARKDTPAGSRCKERNSPYLSSERSAAFLIAFDRLEQRLEVPFAEALRSLPF